VNPALAAITADQPTEPQQDEDDIGRRRQRGGGDVEFGAHQDRRLARQHVADDPADTGGHHPHQRRGHRWNAVAQRLGGAKDRIGGEPDRVEPAQRLVAPPPRRRRPDQRRDEQAHARCPRVVDPEHRRVDQQIANGPAADAGDQPEEDQRDEGLPALGRGEGARRGEHGEPGQIEPARGGGEDFGREDGDGQHGQRRTRSRVAHKPGSRLDADETCAFFDPRRRALWKTACG